MHESIFTGQDLALDCYDGGHAISVITFESRDKNIHALKRSPFGQGFGKGRFAAMGFNEFNVKVSRNHWYQTPEMLDVAKLINRHARNTKVITYGSSMGAFAAINFAGLLNVDTFIALSPLFDIQPGNELGEVRWEIDGKLLDFQYNFIKAGGCRSAKGYLFYCAEGLDEQHAKRIHGETQATLMPLEYGGHPCSFYLNATYKLKAVVEEIARGTFDIDRFYSVLNAKTLETHYPYERRSVELANSGDIEQAMANIEKAISFKPDHPRLHARLAELLLKNSDIAGAEKAYRQAIELAPREPHYFVRLSHVLAARHDFDAAVHQMEKALSLSSKRPEYHVRLGEWLIKAGRLRDAEAVMKTAVRIAPESSHAQARLAATQVLLTRK
jgi:tetratricopeptide (TPR) repeat protein